MSSISWRKKWRLFIDIGHAKCRLVAVSSDLKETRFSEVHSAGLSKGKVSNRDALTDALKLLLDKCGMRHGQYSVFINLPANQTRTIIQTTSFRLNGVYRPQDYDAIIDGAFDSTFGGLDEVIDVLVLQLKIDGSTVDPLRFGVQGNEASVRLLLATHPSIQLSEVLTCVNAAGIEVSEFRSNAFGVARSLGYLRGTAENAVLLDFGHATVTGALMVGGMINQVFCVPAGSGHITRDLSLGMGVDAGEAEKIKLDYGVGEKITSLGSRSNHYVLPRVSELMRLAAKNFAIYSRSLDGGLLFSGGGSALIGLSEFTLKSLGIRPFIAQINRAGAKTFVGLNASGDENSTENSVEDLDPSIKIDSGWVSLLSHARSHVLYQRALNDEKNSRPLSKLNPLWTWLSELSR